MGARGGGPYIRQVDCPGQGCSQLQAVGARAQADGQPHPLPPRPLGRHRSVLWETGSGFPTEAARSLGVSRVGPGPTHLSRALPGSADSLSRWQDKGQAYFCLEPCSLGLQAFPPPAATCFEHPAGVKDRKRWALMPPLAVPKGGSARRQPECAPTPGAGLGGRCASSPGELTSILQVMIPGSLPTALKALLSDMVLSSQGCKVRVSRGVRPLTAGRHPPSFSPKSFPSFSSVILPHVLVVRPAGFAAVGEMTCPSSCCKPGWLGGPHPEALLPPCHFPCPELW